jgi:hypothetical protein
LVCCTKKNLAALHQTVKAAVLEIWTLEDNKQQSQDTHHHTHIETKREQTQTERERESRCEPGLPDFFGYNIPKRDNIYIEIIQNILNGPKYTKWS